MTGATDRWLELEGIDNVRDVGGLPNTVIDELSPAMAQASGLLMAASGQDDLVAGQVAATVRRRGWPAVTGEPGALRKMDAGVAIEELP